MSGSGEASPIPSSAPRYLALGDSYTAGEGVRAEESFPFQLRARLGQNGIVLQNPTVLARTGWTSTELSAAIQAAPPCGTFQLVTLLVGVNNQFRGLAIDSFQAEFRDLLARAIAFAGGEAERVLALSIPDWSQTPFGREALPDWGRSRVRSRHSLGSVSGEIDAFNQAVQAEAALAGTRFVEITSLSRAEGASPGWIAADGLHPSGRQYAAWVEVILPVALAALAQ